MRAQLIPADGGEPIEIVKDMVLVGRKDECDLPLPHKSVSKLHCVLVKTDGLLLLRDLGSTNGTRVNGQRVRRAALLPNDQLQIAGLKFRVHFGPGEPPADAHGHTQRIEAEEVQRLIGKSVGGDDSVRDLPEQPVVQNALPDVIDDGARPAE